MIIVKLQGGLGNQMFQYAAGRALSLRHGVELKADLTFLLDRNLSDVVFRDFDISIFPDVAFPTATGAEISRVKPSGNSSLFSRVSRKFFYSRYYFKEKGFSFNPKFNILGPSIYLDGYWQTEKYFKDIEGQIRSDFRFDNLHIPANVELLEKIRSCDAVCLNVRRGDYVTNSHSSSMHGFIGLDYYRHAVEKINSEVKDPHYFIFSDDIQWSKEHIQTGRETTIVNHDHAGPRFADYLQLMAACKYFIIPNSTFAWWAAWLSSSGKQVIAPLQWFADSRYDSMDIIPAKWTRI
ncbi:MAG: alpha-1,2-fucosyltransferase [Chitinophagaceae bacterium]